MAIVSNLRNDRAFLLPTANASAAQDAVGLGSAGTLPTITYAASQYTAAAGIYWSFPPWVRAMQQRSGTIGHFFLI